MCKKSLTVLLLGMLFFISSCVDKKYDLVNNEIRTDVKIEGNTIALPIGDMKAILLDSLINTDEIDLLEESNGVFSICMDSTISIEESVDPVTFNVDPINHETIIKFNEVNINKVHIAAANTDSAKFKTPEVSLSSLNEELPELNSNAENGFVTVERLEELKKYGIKEIDVTQTVTIEDEKVPCSFTYVLPEEVKTINSIKLGPEEEGNGTLINIFVTNPTALHGCKKEISFEIDFPEMFKLAKNKNAENLDKYEIVNNGHTVKVAGLVPDREVTVLSFYLEELCGVDKYINDGVLEVNSDIEYDIYYTASGNVELTDEMTADDFSFKVALGSKLSFYDVAGSLKEIKVDFSSINMEFSADFDNLQYIDTINYVVFDEEESHIKFNANLGDSDWLETFTMNEGYALRILFPSELDICPIHSVYEGKEDGTVRYDSVEHAFYVYDLNMLVNNEWDLALKELNLNLPVEKDPITEEGRCHLDVKAKIQFFDIILNDTVPYMVLDSDYLESMVGVLNDLEGDKVVDFIMSESDLTIKDAVVDTDVIHSYLETNTTFDFNGEVPSEIGSIEKIGFEEFVDMTLNFSIAGLNDLNTDINIDANITLPPFLKLSTVKKDPNVKIENGILSIKNISYNPYEDELLNVKLVCTGLDFTMMGGLTPENSMVSCESEVVVDGDVTVEDEDMHSTVLGQDITFNIGLVMDPITVKTFHGCYSGEIEAVDEKIALDLGEDLEFLREEGNSIKLADPQMEFVLTNTIGVPVDIDLLIFGSDENGVQIGEPISSTLSILPAEYDEASDTLKPVKTKLFLTTDTLKNNKGGGYKNVEIPALANLLEKVPYDINFKIEPKIMGNSHHVDILNPIKLDGTYSVIVPLKFEDLNICYTDTVSGIKEGMGDTLDKFTNASLRLKMNVANTIPLGVALSVKPLDENAEPLEGFEILDINIKAGNGSDIVNNDVSSEDLQEIVFSIGSKGGDFSELDKLLLSVNATANSTTGGIGLKGEQGIKISDIVLEVSGDIEFK